MPNSLKCKIKHLCHNRTITESERDRILKALEQEPCEDAVSRQAVKEQMIKYGFLAPDMTVAEFVEDYLQPVNLQEKGNCTRVSIKLCNNADADIIEFLKNQENKQEYIKELIREDIVIQKKIKYLKQCKGGDDRNENRRISKH